MAEDKTLDERLIELLELQRQQLEVLRDQKDSSEASLNAISEQVIKNRSENSSRFGSIDTRLTRVEGNLDVVVAQLQHTSTLIAAVDTRSAYQDKRLSDLSNRAIRLETGVAAVDAKTETIQQRCAAHDEKLSYLNMTCEELKERIDEHVAESEEELKSVKEVSGELRLEDIRLKEEMRREIQAAREDGKEVKTKVDQTWKVIAILGSGLVALAGLIFGLIKLLAALSVVLLLGCYKHTVYSQTMMAYDKADLGTTGLCERPADALRVADIGLPIILTELQRAKYVTDTAGLARQIKKEVIICLLPEPEPCKFNSVVIGPWKEMANGRIQGARKGGCADRYAAWASLRWPFLCSGEWPDEPHCTGDPDAISEAGWEQRMLHELFNMVVARVRLSALPTYNEDGTLRQGYTDAVYMKVEPEVRDRFLKVWK